MDDRAERRVGELIPTGGTSTSSEMLFLFVFVFKKRLFDKKVQQIKDVRIVKAKVSDGIAAVEFQKQ